jgi:hypothetical protein
VLGTEYHFGGRSSASLEVAQACSSLVHEAVSRVASRAVAHNRSPTRLRSDVLASPLAVYRGWRLELECAPGGCPVGRIYQLDRLLRACGGDATVGQITRRLRCVVCGRAPETIILAEERPGRRVALAGPEIRY